MKTIQLRRYTLVDGEYDAFLAWWKEWMPRVRPAAGFAIEFAYGLPETNEFVWAVSAEGDQDAFLAREEVYLASDGRAEAFDGLPQRVAEYNMRLRRRDRLTRAARRRRGSAAERVADRRRRALQPRRDLRRFVTRSRGRPRRSRPARRAAHDQRHGRPIAGSG